MRAYFGAVLVFSTSVFLLGCPVGHQSPPARAQEAANELNVNTRFGRMELATERVAPAARDAFMARRRAWGVNVRVADYELAGFKMKGNSDAEMLVKVAWYRMNEGDLRMTTLKQQWHDFKGEWRLVDENRADGDLGLLGESLPAAEPGKGRNAQFKTIRLGQGASDGTASPEEPAEPQPSSPSEPAPAPGPAPASPKSP